jgi:hypothetical protein
MCVCAAGTLYLAVSDYSEAGWLVYVEVTGCERVDRLLESQTKMWSEVVTSPAKIGSARPNWKRDVPDMLLAQPGVVLTVRILQEVRVREQKWRWGGISRKVDAWRSTNKTNQVFAGVAESASHSPCERFAIGERRYSALVWEQANDTPPEKLPAFLRLYVLQQVPPEYVRYMPKTS